MRETPNLHVLMEAIICTDLVLLVVCEVVLPAAFLETGLLLHKEESVLQIMKEQETATAIIVKPKQTTETINQNITNTLYENQMLNNR